MSTKKTKPGAAKPAAEATEAETPAKATKAPGAGRGKQGGTTPGKSAKPRQKPPRRDAEAKAKAERKARTGTKQEQLIAMLRAKDGVTVEEAAKAFSWQAHTVRGALYGALKTKLGLDIVSEKIEGRGRVYRIRQLT